MRPGIATAFFGIMLPNSSGNIVGNPRVKGAIGALHDIDEPFLIFRLTHKTQNSLPR